MQRRFGLPGWTALLGLLAVTVSAPFVAESSAQRPGRPQRAGRPAPAWDRAVLDVFFTDAREHLGPGSEPTGIARPTAPQNDLASPSSNATTERGSGVAWAELVSAAALEDEVKSLVTPLSTTVRSGSSFKGGGYREARTHLSWLAALFRVVAEYDGDVRWREDAAGLQAAFAHAGQNCKVGADNSFNEAKLRSDDLAQLVRGGKVSLEDAAPDAAWNETANRPPLMKRMEQAYDERITTWTAGGNEFSRNRDALERETELLLMTAEIIKDPSYEFGDDETYREYLDELQGKCRELLEAVREDDFPRAQSAAAQMGQSCTACHGDFRG